MSVLTAWRPLGEREAAGGEEEQGRSAGEVEVDDDVLLPGLRGGRQLEGLNYNNNNNNNNNNST